MDETTTEDNIYREDVPAWDGQRFGQTFESARIYVHIAKEAPIAAVLRRGPGQKTALLKWNLETDEVELGQWVNARIYERRCDISPDGKYFLYFAAKHTGPLYSWTAISILPWFRACALWHKGDCWGGGGLFDENRNLLLNHRPEPFRDGPDEFSILGGNLPRPWKSFAPFGQHSGWGEDEPIHSEHMRREGWIEKESITKAAITYKGPYRWVVEGANIWTKSGVSGHELHLVHDAHNENNGRAYMIECRLVSDDGAYARSFGRVDWADWHKRDVVFARNGCLWRVSDLKNGTPKRVSDLNPMKYERLTAPYEGAQGRILKSH